MILNCTTCGCSLERAHIIKNPKCFLCKKYKVAQVKAKRTPKKLFLLPVAKYLDYHKGKVYINQKSFFRLQKEAQTKFGGRLIK